jgi:hypothetical protein
MSTTPGLWSAFRHEHRSRHKRNRRADPADVAVIIDGLSAYDFSQIGYRDFHRLTVFVRDPLTGKVVSGRYGRSEFGLVYVDWLFLPEDFRRWGIGAGY